MLRIAGRIMKPDLARGPSFETARTRLLRMRSEYAAAEQLFQK